MAVVLDKSLPTLGPRDAGLPMTLDEFEAADFRPGHRYELIHGVLVVTPSPLEEERDSNEELGHLLRVYQEAHPQGSSLNLTLPEHTLRTVGQIRRCDRAIWAGLGRMPVTRGPAARRDPPAIVAEFPSSRASDQRRDYEEKRIEYRDLGVKEYWIIDRFRRTLTVYSWRRSKWGKRLVRADDTYRTPLLPGFDLPLARLFAVADKYRGLPADEL
jgi:Uma2 family endonuclease